MPPPVDPAVAKLVSEAVDKARLGQLRDTIALEAMKAALAMSTVPPDDFERLSRHCYRLADAMIAAREPQQP